MESVLLGQESVIVLRSKSASVMSPCSSTKEIGIELGAGSICKG
jgi:hypothetical protein